MKFAVLGAGAWGTAFALHLARLGRPVVLVPRRAEHAEAIRAAGENVDYLPGVPFPRELEVTADTRAALAGTDVVLLACPSQALRETSQRVRDNGGARIVLSLAKGLELGTHLRPSQVIADVLPASVVGSLSGPTNAAEFAKAIPSAMVLACGNSAEACAVQEEISGPTLRVYTSEDLPGVEFGGSLKNVYAIAAGCSDGFGLGDNTRAALLTRALAEMVRLGVTLGARPETFYGLSGFGDLVATCHGAWSRNREFGEQIGAGKSVAELLQGRKTVVEGYRTTQSFHGLCVEKGIDAPILQEMHGILFEGRSPAEALRALMSRTLKPESLPPT